MKNSKRQFWGQYSGFSTKIKSFLERNLFKAAMWFIGRFVTAFLVEASQARLLVPAYDMHVARSLRLKGAYQDDELSQIFALVVPDSVVVFIGAHIGALAIPTAREAGKVVVVEANPSTFALLSTNIHLNSVSNIQAFNVAVGETNGFINFVMNTDNSGGSKREPKVKAKEYYYDNPETITVPQTRLDDLLVDDVEIDLIVMDIEGSEFFALLGMEKTLTRTKSLIVEFIPHHFSNVAGISVKQFVELISRYFDYCYVPSKSRHLCKSEFYTFLDLMFLKNEEDPGLLFSKQPLDNHVGFKA
tara:strand:+ start:164 stop:1069 length:906 start_codon:yes stop_codon:yes gene_type:complete